MSSEAQANPAGSVTRKIAVNSVWFAVDSVVMVGVAFVVSVLMARMIGPERLGYFVYIQWLANVSRILGSLGVPMATRKYMAEYFGRGDPGVAYAVYRATMRFQWVTSLVITGLAVALVLAFADRSRMWVSAVQVLSILPSMLVFIPTQANAAREDIRANMIGSLVSSVVYCGGALLSLAVGWDLMGIAIMMLLSRVAELLTRVVFVNRWIRQLPFQPLPEDVRGRIWTFATQNTILMLVNVVVWDRSEVLFLKEFSSSAAQITFYTLAFNLCENALEGPRVFGMALGVSLMAQYGRDKSRLNPMMATAGKYAMLASVPLLGGLGAMSAAVVPALYGKAYLPAIPVLTVAAMLAVLKPLLLPAQQYLQAHEQQQTMVRWTLFCAGLNVVLDLVLISRWESFGAAIGNGVSQAIAGVGLWVLLIRRYRVPLQLPVIGRIVLSGAVMSVVTWYAVGRVSIWTGLVCGPVIGGSIYIVLLWAFGVLDEEDRFRLMKLRKSLPGPVGVFYERVVEGLTSRAG